MKQLVCTSSLAIITLRFTFFEKKICSTIKKSDFLQFFYIFINSFNCWRQSYFGWNFLYLSKKTSLTKLERLSIPNLDLIKNFWKIVTKLDKFQHFFLQISCSNLWLKLCQRPESYENCQTDQIGRVQGQGRSKKLSRDNHSKNIGDKL